MHPNQIPEKPMTPGVGRLDRAERIYFFERPDGSIVNATGSAAWNMYSKRPQILGQFTVPFKYIGSSDGVKYREAIMEAQKLLTEKGLEVSQERLRQALREEQEIARGHMVPPPDYDTIGQGGVPIDLKNLR